MSLPSSWIKAIREGRTARWIAINIVMDPTATRFIQNRIVVEFSRIKNHPKNRGSLLRGPDNRLTKIRMED